MSTATTAANTSNALNPAAPSTGRPPKMSTTAKVLDAQRKPGSPVDPGQRKPPPTKAWTQGTNPITQRPTNPSPSNGVVNAPKPAQLAAASSGETASPMRHLSDRMMYLLANLTGLPGIITLKNGEKYSGVLSGTSLDPSELRYVFKMVKKLLPASRTQTNGTSDISDDYVGVGDYHVMSFDMSDVADFHVNNVVLDKSQSKGQNGAAAFRTDTDISGNMAIRERNLKKWEPDEIDPSMTLESSGRSTDWDQFSTNERLFGVKSNYDETYYTTTINRSDPQYAQRAARAEKIAREIESSTAMNSHVREERGGNVADDGGDEEDKYSGVRRDLLPLSSGQSNRYTPPARRAPSAQPTVPGAPVDPAIISSSVARPDSSKPIQRTASPAVENAAAPEATKPDQQKTQTQPPVEAQKDASQKPEPSAQAPTKQAEPPQKPSSAIKPVVAAIPPRKAGRPHDATTNVEHELLDSFKQFSAAEKLRISDRQRTIARENKAVKLNDLKKFALNFKLSTPVPSDLVPILAKDETKQQAIVEKALRQAQETKTTPPKTTTAVAEAKPAPRPAVTKPESTHASPSAVVDRQQPQRSRPGQSQYPSNSLRERSHQNPPQGSSRNHGLLSERLQLNQQQHKQRGAMPYNGVPQPIPTHDMRNAPTGPSQPGSGNQTPSSNASTRFNVRAHEFKPNPSAHAFQPGSNMSNNSSPRPDSASKPEPRRSLAATSFFGGQRAAPKQAESPESFHALSRLQKEAQNKDRDKVQGKDKTHSTDIPQPFRTPPTWDFPTTNANKTYEQLFENTPAPPPLSAPQNVMGNGMIPHQHQLPPHLQGPQPMPQGQGPHHTPRGPPGQPHHGQAPHPYEAQHMQFSHSATSVHPSPRPMPPYVYSQPAQPMPGYPQPVQVPQYGMSPNVQHVSLRNAQPTQFINPPGPAMGGHMMTNQPSNGPFMGMPGNPQMQMYSPGPAPAYPQYPGQMPGGPPNGGYPNSPRPGAPMMSHQGSQQGHQQAPMMYMQAGGPAPQMFQMPPGSMTPMRNGYVQPHQPHYSPQHHQQYPHHQHRGTPSGSYAQPVMPQHPIPPQGPPSGPANHGPEGSDEPK